MAKQLEKVLISKPLRIIKGSYLKLFLFSSLVFLLRPSCLVPNILKFRVLSG